MERIARVHHEAVAGEGAVIVLDPEETHHVLRVLRVRPGDRVFVFDGKGREWEGVLVSAGRSGAEVRTIAEISGRVDPVLEVVLYQALCRPERMEWLIQKGTEVGLAAIRPFAARRSEVPAPSAERMKRFGRVALEAAKQSGRRVVPAVAEPVDTVPPPPDGTCALRLDTAPGARPLGEHLAGPKPGAVWLLVGPEGGFDPDEAEAFEAAGWLAAGLGPRTLRTETAGAIAAALVLHAWDDLGPARRA
jgi:16S rRNA (uracil1498-N3)-methyltransferase